MKILSSILMLLFLIVYQSCSIPNPEKKDFVGKWKSDDGAIFIFMNDNTFKAENLPGEKIFDGFVNLYNKKYNESGVWNITRKEGRWIIQIVFSGSKELNTSFFTQVYIAGENGIASNKPPWYFYKYIGDPDEGIMYEFTKIP